VAKNNLKNLITDKLQDWMNAEIEPSDNLIAVNVPTDPRELDQRTEYSSRLARHAIGAGETEHQSALLPQQLFPV